MKNSNEIPSPEQGVSRSENKGRLAQMVERSLSMREARGSIPRFSTSFCSLGTESTTYFCCYSIQAFCETRWLPSYIIRRRSRNDSEVAQWERAGLITLRSSDRNRPSLPEDEDAVYLLFWSIRQIFHEHLFCWTRLWFCLFEQYFSEWWFLGPSQKRLDCQRCPEREAVLWSSNG